MSSNHLIIAGPGRSGTSLLVALLGELGLETGEDRLTYFRQARAGWEVRLPDPDAPYVVKDPSFDLERLVEGGHLEVSAIDGLIVPLRELEQATLSRKRLSVATLSPRVPGGMLGTSNPWRQKAVLAEGTYRLLERAAAYEVPVTLLAYPRFAQDVAYAYRRIAPLLGPDCDEPTFTAAWQRTVDPELVVRDPLHASIGLNLRLALKAPLIWLRSLKRRVARLVRGDA